MRPNSREEAIEKSCRFAFTLFILLVSWAAVCRADNESPKAVPRQSPRNVFMAFSFGDGILVQQDTYALFRANMAAYPTPPQYFGEYLDLVRFSSPAYRSMLVGYLKQKYSGTRIDLVVCFAFPALQFWSEYGPQIFPNAPVLFMGVDERRLQQIRLGPAAGLTISFDDRGLLDLVLQLHPDTRHIFLVAGSTDFERFWVAERLKTLMAYRPDLAFTDMTNLSASGLAEALRKLPQRSVVLFQDLYRDSSGRYFQGDEGINLVCKTSNAPVYGFYANYVGRGLVGGRVFDPETGPRAARLAVRLLSGEKPEAVGIQPSSANTNMFDGRELTRWQIDRSRLPKGSLVLFERPSLWELYKWRLVAIGLLCLLETFLIFALFVQLARRRRADLAVARLHGQLLNAQEEERVRIARDLHDDFGQQLAAIGLGLSRFEKQFSSSAAAGKAIGQLDDKLVTLGEAMRHLSHELHPAVLDHAGLAAALRTHCNEFNSVSEIKADSVVEPDPLALPADVALCLYRLTQESLRNVAKHSRATHARVRVKASAQAVELTIADNGAGFDVNALRAGRGLGLQSMKERVKLLRGTLNVSSGRATGTVLTVRLPLDQT